MLAPRGDKIALITLSRDNPEDLLRTLRSTSLQHSQPDYQIVVDSSSSELRAQMERISEEGSAQYVWVEPEGIYPAMKFSLDLAPSDHYLWWLNSSDRLTGIETVTRARAAIRDAQQHASPHWIVGQLIRARNNRIGLHRVGHSGSEFSQMLTRGATGFPHPSALFFSASLKEIKAFQSQLKIAEDYRLSLEFLQKWGPPWVAGSPLAIHTPDGYSYQRPLRNLLEKQYARAQTLGARRAVTGIPMLLFAIARGALERASGNLGWNAPLDDWMLEQPDSLHFCGATTARNWPECCEAYLRGGPV